MNRPRGPRLLSRGGFARLFQLGSHLLLSACVACAGPLLTKEDYRPSLNAYYRDTPQLALERFPDGESGEFVTTMERTLLGLLRGDADLLKLAPYVDDIENRVRYKVSRELRFMLLETSDGYYASEHEIVWMHLLLSWGYSAQGQRDKGCVEAKRASNFLENPWSYEGAFDDPALRIMLAGLWAMCGSWGDAQVDLRRAHILDPSLAWARQLSDLQPPQHLTLVLGGVGPVPRWDPRVDVNVVRAARGVEFHSQARRKGHRVADVLGNGMQLHLSPGSLPWYRRHITRDQELHETIADSRYSGKMVASGAAATGEIVATVALGVVLTVASLVLGAGIAYLGAEADSDKLVGAGVGIALGGAAWSVNTAKNSVEDAANRFKRRLDPTEQYRFVRYLPEYIGVAWSDKPLRAPVRLHDADGRVMPHTAAVSAGPVTILHAPDVDQGSADPRIWLRGNEWLLALRQQLSKVELTAALQEALATAESPRASVVAVSFEADGMQLRATISKWSVVIVEPRGFFSSNNSLTMDQGGDRFANAASERAFLTASPRAIAAALTRAVRQRAEENRRR